LVEFASQLFQESIELHNGNLCVGGGLFLNCNSNYKIMRESGFKQMHMFPACGDDGLSVGSALYATHVLYKFPRQTYENKELMFLGYEYPDFPESNFEPLELDLNYVAEALTQGQIVCWYQGGGEIGPRALGHRSFLVDPRREEMKDVLNSRVKFREWYRPFAPVVLNEFKEEWFRMDFESPFMLFTVPCKRPFDIPAGVHIDNTARVQTLRKQDNEKLYELIYKFYEKTDVPILLNTSLNVKGRPIVEDPWQAMNLFEDSDVDLLVINDKMYKKN
jgi:carbamoyltransferase